MELLELQSLPKLLERIEDFSHFSMPRLPPPPYNFVLPTQRTPQENPKSTIMNDFYSGALGVFSLFSVFHPLEMTLFSVCLSNTSVTQTQLFLRRKSLRNFHYYNHEKARDRFSTGRRDMQDVGCKGAKLIVIVYLEGSF